MSEETKDAKGTESKETKGSEENKSNEENKDSKDGGENQEFISSITDEFSKSSDELDETNNQENNDEEDEFDNNDESDIGSFEGEPEDVDASEIIDRTRINTKYLNKVTEKFSDSKKAAFRQLTENLLHKNPAEFKELIRKERRRDKRSYKAATEQATQEIEKYKKDVVPGLIEKAVEKVLKGKVAAETKQKIIKAWGEPHTGGKTPEPQNTNPWAKGKRNLTEQGRIFRENPDLARRLEAQAKK